MNVCQYLVTTSEDGVSVRRVELTVPSGMSVQLTEWECQTDWTKLRLPLLYEGNNYESVVRIIKP